MLIVLVTCALLLVATTVIHYEVLRRLNTWLPSVRIPDRRKLVVVILGTFLAHAAQVALYGLAFYLLIGWLDLGRLEGAEFSLASCMYLSAESFTTLGFGDLTPLGPVRMLAGVEGLNGLLLIGWSASFTYIAMQRFWAPPAEPG